MVALLHIRPFWKMTFDMYNPTTCFEYSEYLALHSMIEVTWLYYCNDLKDVSGYI